MNYSLRERIGMVLDRVPVLNRLVLRFDGIAPNGRLRYVNRVSGHFISLPKVKR